VTKKSPDKKTKQQMMQEKQSTVPALYLGNIETPHAGSLEDVKGIRAEMVRVYRLVFQGKIMLDEATRLSYMLTQMIQAVKAEAELDTLQKAYAKAWGGVMILTDDSNEAIDGTATRQ
jgi:hypothetical protein